MLYRHIEFSRTFVVGKSMSRQTEHLEPESNPPKPFCVTDLPSNAASLRGTARTYRKIRRTVRVILFTFFGLILYAVGCHADRIARPIVFQPTRFPAGRWNERFPVTFEEITFTNARNEKLVGWYFPIDKKEKFGTILYCHGNGGNISYMAEFADLMRQKLGCSVLIFDYAGYGKSEGTPTAPGILDDGRAARSALAKKEGIKETDIIVYGQSLGGSVAIDLAAKDGARALIVESSFTSLNDVGQRLLPFLPVRYLLKERLPSVEKIGEFKGPVFISHGRGDTTIPFEQGQRLFDTANEPKTFYIPSKGRDYHSAPLGNEHWEQLRSFLQTLQRTANEPKP